MGDLATADGLGPRQSSATVLVGGDENGGRFALVETIEIAGGEPPRHLHHEEDETLYVAEGTLRVWLAGNWIEVSTGAAIFLPRGVEHTFAVTTERARILALLTPAGFEGFYHDLGAGQALPGLEQLVATAARYGCEITGPPVRPDPSPPSHRTHLLVGAPGGFPTATRP
jgi:quercetin dioxygenase-like cupin family protein